MSLTGRKFAFLEKKNSAEVGQKRRVIRHEALTHFWEQKGSSDYFSFLAGPSIKIHKMKVFKLFKGFQMNVR